MPRRGPRQEQQGEARDYAPREARSGDRRARRLLEGVALLHRAREPLDRGYGISSEAAVQGEGRGDHDTVLAQDRRAGVERPLEGVAQAQPLGEQRQYGAILLTHGRRPGLERGPKRQSAGHKGRQRPQGAVSSLLGDYARSTVSSLLGDYASSTISTMRRRLPSRPMDTTTSSARRASSSSDASEGPSGS
jgi:hypothetical protein